MTPYPTLPHLAELYAPPHEPEVPVLLPAHEHREAGAEDRDRVKEGAEVE